MNPAYYNIIPSIGQSALRRDFWSQGAGRVALWVENNLGTEVLRDVAGVVGISNLLLTLASGGPRMPLYMWTQPLSPPPWEGTDDQGFSPSLPLVPPSR